MPNESKLLQKYLETQIGFRGPLVTIDEFMDNPYYLGSIYPPGSVFPYWREKLRELFPNSLITKSSYIALTGCIGAGKSTFSKAVMAYDVYKMSMMKDPRKFFGIMFNNGYFIKCFNLTKEKAYNMVQELTDLFQGKPVAGGACCPYFRDQIKYGNRFLKNVHVVAAAKKKDLISDDCIGFILSEINDAKREVADMVMHEAENRLWARCRNGMNLFNHLIFDSAARNEGSLIDDFIKDNPSAKDCFQCRPSHWESRKGMGIYGTKGWFKFYLGDSKYSPFIIKKESDIDSLKLDPEQILEIPNEYYNQAAGSQGKDLLAFIQDVCGRSTGSAYRFFSEPEKVVNSCTLPQICPEIVKLDFYDRYDTLYDKLLPAIMQIPADKKLYIGLDCGVNHDLYGLAIGYADGLERYNDQDGGKLDYLSIKIPIAVGISRYDGQETPINKVHDFILRLAEDYDIGCVYSDQYQSTSSRQILIQNDIPAERVSIDIDDSAYVAFKHWIYMGLVSMPNSELLKHEVLGLERVYVNKNRYKVEKPRDGISHGDVTAAVVHVVSQIIELGPDEVLTTRKMNKAKYSQILDSVNKPRMIRPMV